MPSDSFASEDNYCADVNDDVFSSDDMASDFLLANTPALEVDIATGDNSICDNLSVVDTDDHQDQTTFGLSKNDLDTSLENDGPWCYCQEDRPDLDQMVGCDNQDCPIQWFHLSCLNLTVEQLPSGDWFCPECS